MPYPPHHPLLRTLLNLFLAVSVAALAYSVLPLVPVLLAGTVAYRLYRSLSALDAAARGSDAGEEGVGGAGDGKVGHAHGERASGAASPNSPTTPRQTPLFAGHRMSDPGSGSLMAPQHRGFARWWFGYREELAHDVFIIETTPGKPVNEMVRRGGRGGRGGV